MKSDGITIGTTKIYTLQRRQRTKNSTVTKSNQLARCEIENIQSVMFGRLFNTFIAQIKRDDVDFRDYEIPMINLMPDGKRSGVYYNMLDVQSDKWLEVVIKISIDANNFIKYPLFSKIHVNTDKNTIIVNVHKDLKPHLLQLKDHFTQYSLEEYMRLSTVRTQRLFELLSSWRTSDNFKIEIEDLHNFLGNEEYLRKNFKDFRNKVLDIARKDILKNTALYYRWEAETRGRKVVAVIFHFTELTEEEKAAQKIKEMSLLQKKSNKCYERHTLSENECTPKKKSQICKYCLERGRMSAK